MKNPKSVALFLPSLQGGGAERFMVDLSNGLSEQGYKVSLVVGNLRGQYFSEINEKVEIVDLKSIRTLYCVPGLIRFLRRCKPDTLISTIYHANMVAILSALLSFTKTKIIVRDSNMHKTLKEASSSFFSYKLTFLVMRFLYNQSDAIVAVSQAMKDELRELMPEVESKLHLIHNFIDIDQINILSEEPVDHPWLQEDFDIPIMLSAGRLSNQKNWPVLLRAFADVVAKRDLRLIILGEGEKRNEIENLIEELGIQDKISMPGFKQNPFSWMAKAEIFALSSDAEGFPNVLVQALNCGCKVISSDCGSGPREILEQGKWGRLFKVGDVEDLSNKILFSLQQDKDIDPKERAKYFSHERCLGQYRELFAESKQTA
jgi:glycosyltransferase involved in cell wall biosynthesis